MDVAAILLQSTMLKKLKDKLVLTWSISLDENNYNMQCEGL